MKTLLFVSILFLSGCATKLVGETNNPKGGVVGIPIEGWKSFQEDKRNQAYDIMKKYCSGDYSIDREENERGGERRRLYFTCKDQPTNQAQK